MTDEVRVQVSAPATPDMMDLAHEAIQRLWNANDTVGAVDRLRFETAVVEILGNIIEHAYAQDSHAPATRRFDLALTVSDDEVIAEFGDDGRPVALDLSTVALPDDYAESGRGLAMAMAAVDDLSYDRIDGRNHWRLSVRRKG